MIVLGIETSCDETAAAIVNSEHKILSESIHSQIDTHRKYLGVVPELAARSHIELCDKIIMDVFNKTDITIKDIDAIAATAGPGLIGGLLVGLTTAKAISVSTKKPFLAINHLDAHALTPRLTNKIKFPYLLLLISGGHTMFLSVEGPGKHIIIGNTIDDALGEAYDKTARLLGLGFPGGAELEKLAKSGNEKRFKFPMPLKGKKGCDFSFSGLKTSVRQTAEKNAPLSAQVKADIAASFQYTVCEVIAEKMRNAIEIFSHKNPDSKIIAAAGGVASNLYIKSTLENIADERGFALIVPPSKYCTDNGAMIAWAGIEHRLLGVKSDYAFDARARWSLEGLKI